VPSTPAAQGSVNPRLSNISLEQANTGRALTGAPVPKKGNMQGLTAGAIVLLVIGLIIFAPFFTIWAINTLFGLGIAYTFKTWCASLILTAAFGKASITVKK
jgi:hypothetical protein